MENITLPMVWAWILGAAGAIFAISNAIKCIVEAWKAAKAPNARQDERLDDVEKRLDTVERKLTTDHNHLGAIDEGNRVTQRALLALLDHGIDGNNIKQMQHAKEELQDHLINR